MKGKFYAIGSGALETGGGILISIIWGNLLWLGWTLISIGIISLLLCFIWKYIVKCSKWLQSKIKMIIRVVTRIKEANQILLINDDQKKKPEKWLFPVIEYIDLNRQGNIKVDAAVAFQIDSHLLNSINEFYVFLKLCLYDTVTYQETESKVWHEIEQPEHYAPIGKLERHAFGSASLNLGRNINAEDGNNKLLLEMIEKFRNGDKIYAMLKIGMAFKKEGKNTPILLEGSRWIAPMNDYRMG